MWGYNRRYVPEMRKRRFITVFFDKGKDNDGTLKSKLIGAYRKTGTDFRNLNTDLQHLKQHKSVDIFYV